MELKEEKRNLASVNDRRYNFCHCISADFDMKSGIGEMFNQSMGIQVSLLANYPDYLQGYKSHRCDCIKVGRVYNLVTKEKFWEKGSYSAIEKCLILLADQCKRERTHFLAMPRLGCGHDGLDWAKVKALIYEAFKDVSIEILICHI